jgi:hypothetical protein
MMRVVAALAAALACAAISLGAAAAVQQSDDLLISPTYGAKGSRFQVVGVNGWTPGETVTLRIGFTAADPAAFAGPFPFTREITVLRDGTWSFPINVNDDLLGAPLGDTPGYLVIQATSPSNSATSAFVYAPGGQLPPGAPPLAVLGGGFATGNHAFWLALALFTGATGILVAASGRLRLGERLG